MTAAPVLNIERLHVGLPTQRGSAPRLLLRGIDLAIGAGEVHALVGDSGAGTSMVGRAVLGILPAAVRVFAGASACSATLAGRPRPAPQHLGSDVA
jgi:ABC-type glutathione transport system ATPase component